jgi:hypothetical protein
MQEQPSGAPAGGLFTPGQAPAQPQMPAGPQPQAPTAVQPQTDINWSASEFIDHSKPSGWYGMFIAGAIVGIVAIYFITRDFISVGVLLIFAVVFLVLSKRKPRVLQYGIGPSGIQIGEKLYPMGMFRAFAIIDEGALHSITVLPLKKISPPLNIYFAPDDERTIIEALGSYLPQEQRQQDMVDRLMRRIHF